MKKVFEILGMDKPIDGDFGIEIEAEGRGMVAVANQYWHTEADGSLRGHYPDGAAEFVLDKPIKLNQVRDALETLQKALHKAELKFSFRTSVHVHTNVQDLTYEQLLNFIYTYLLLEEPLTTFCGKERKGNRFCLRLADAEGMLYTMNKMFKGTGHEIGEINGENVRYAAINLAALPKYGSLEFRAMRGNLDVDTIDTWCSALYALREYAKSKPDPLAILEDYKANSPTSFLKSVLGPALSKSFLYPRIIKDIQRSFSLSLDLPHAFLAAQKEREKLR